MFYATDRWSNLTNPTDTPWETKYDVYRFLWESRDFRRSLLAVVDMHCFLPRHRCLFDHDLLTSPFLLTPTDTDVHFLSLIRARLPVPSTL